MTALSADKNRQPLNWEPEFIAAPIAASTVIFAGSMVALNASGLLVPAADTAGLQVLGTADEGYDNSAGAAGVLYSSPAHTKVDRRPMPFACAGSPVAGARVYVVDDNNVSTIDPGNGVVAGWLIEPSPFASGVWYVMPPPAPTTRAGRSYQFGVSGAKVGATAGWVAAGASDLGEATCPAAQTGATLVIPVSGLRVGSIITAFKVQAQIESGGNTATLDAALRKLTNAAADPTDALVGAITQISVTADTAASAEKTGLTETVGEDEAFYMLFTATTAAATDIRLLGFRITVTEQD